MATTRTARLANARHRKRSWRWAAVVLLFTSGCGSPPPRAADPLARVAGDYVRLVAALGHRDSTAPAGDTAAAQTASHPWGPASAGPPKLASATAAPLAELIEQTRAALLALDGLAGDAAEPRRAWLRAQLRAVEARAAQLAGATSSVDTELEQFYGARRPSELDLAGLHDIRARLSALLPGEGPPAARLDDFEALTIVPGPRLAAVFERALAECRARTLARMELPSGERVSVKYVVGESWSGFSRYEGHGRSVVSVNTSYPLTVDRVLQLACHEGYPGHHVINVLRDAQVQAGRLELAAVPLYSPEAYQTEALATRATSLVFTSDERAAFERDVLFPLAGLPASEAGRHVEVATLVEHLAPAIGDALVRFLSGERDFLGTGWVLQDEALMRHPQATLQFARQYRTFSLAYAAAATPRASLVPSWLELSGFPAGPVMISRDGHHSSAGSQRR